MSKQEAVLAFQTQILADVGIFDADGEGYLSCHWEGVNTPVTIDSKRLCLPVKSILDQGDWTARIAFSPLAEQIGQGPSPILNALKEYIQLRLKSTAQTLAIALMELAVDIKRQKGMSADAAKFTTQLVGADKKTAEALTAVLKGTASPAPEKRLISLFLKNGGENGALRSCVVNFPFMEDPNPDDLTTFFGVKGLRTTKIKDKQLIINLLDYVLGTPAERASYTKSSNDGEAPYFHSLLLSFYAVASHFNKLIQRHVAACPALEGLEFNLAWADTLMEFGVFAAAHSRAIPSLPGNRGKERDEVTASPYDVAGDDVGLSDTPRRPAGDERSRSRRQDEPVVELSVSSGTSNSGGKERSLSEILRGNRQDDDYDDRPRRSEPSRSSGRGGSRHSNGRGSRRW